MHTLLLLLARISLVIALLFTISQARAQYKLTTGTTSYQTLTEADRVYVPWADTVNPYTYVDLGGEAFNFYGETFTLDAINPLGISKYGNLELKNEKSAIIIDAFHLSIIDSVAPASTVQMRLSGAPGERVLWVEWRDVGLMGLSAEYTLSFQLALHQRSGMIEFFYGPHDLGCDSTVAAPQGPFVGIFKAKRDFSVFQKIFWLVGDPAAPKISQSSIKQLDCLPMPNTTYAISAPASTVERSITATPITLEALLSPSENSDISVSNVLGQRITSSLAQLPAGLYFVELRAEQGLSKRYKVAMR